MIAWAVTLGAWSVLMAPQAQPESKAATVALPSAWFFTSAPTWASALAANSTSARGSASIQAWAWVLGAGSTSTSESTPILASASAPSSTSAPGSGPVSVSGAASAPASAQSAGPRPYLGIELLAITKELREHYGADAGRGMLVSRVDPKGPATAAGLIVGDLVVSLDGRDMTGFGDAVIQLAGRKPGDTIDVLVLREGKPKTIAVTLSVRSGVQVRVGPFQWRGPSPLIDHNAFNETMRQLQKRLQSLDGRNMIRLQRHNQSLEGRLRELERKLQELEARLGESA